MKEFKKGQRVRVRRYKEVYTIGIVKNIFPSEPRFSVEWWDPENKHKVVGYYHTDQVSAL